MTMFDEERYLWLWHFQYHGQGHIWWAYFIDEQEVEAFVRTVKSLLPCLSITLLEERKEGLAMVNDFLYYRLSSQLTENERCRREKLRLSFRVQPAPIKRDYLSSFLCSLDRITPCPWCAQSLAEVKAIVARARHTSVVV